MVLFMAFYGITFGNWVKGNSRSGVAYYMYFQPTALHFLINFSPTLPFLLAKQLFFRFLLPFLLHELSSITSFFAGS